MKAFTRFLLLCVIVVIIVYIACFGPWAVTLPPLAPTYAWPTGTVVAAAAPTLTPTVTKTPWPWGGLARVAESVTPGTYDLACLWQSRYCAPTGALTRVYRWANNVSGGPIDVYWMRFSGHCFSDYETWCRGCPVGCTDCSPCTVWQGGSSVATSASIVIHVSAADFATWQLATWEGPFALVMFDIAGRPCEDPSDRRYCP